MQGSQDAKEPADDSEPTHTGTRSVHALRAAQLEHAQQRESARGSTRPSAFGLPPSGLRAKLPAASPAPSEPAFTSVVIEKRRDGAAHSRELPPHGPTTREPPTREVPSSPKAAGKAQAATALADAGRLGPAAMAAPARLADALRPPRAESAVATPRALGAPLPSASDERRSTPRVKTDIEQLLPISHVAKSLPEPPRLPQLEPVRTSPRRFPWVSLATFVLMISASALTLSRYSEIRQSTSEASALALDGQSEFELARRQFERGDLAEAERSLVAALRKNSQAREYHALYAELLERTGRREEALRERELAAE